jgi:hypothetical protein
MFGPDNDIPVARFARKSTNRTIIIGGEIWAGYNSRLCTTDVVSTICEEEQFNIIFLL